MFLGECCTHSPIFTVLYVYFDFAAKFVTKSKYICVWCMCENPLYIDGFGEGLRLAKEKLGEKNIYYMNPSFDK